MPNWIDSINPQHISSENEALVAADTSGMFKDFF